MQTTMDAAGHRVVPKKLRDRLALGDGGRVEVVERDGVIEIHSVPAAVELVEGPGEPVAQPLESLPALIDADVRRRSSV